MSDEVEILLVEDNPADIELTKRALRKARIANPIRVCRDGAEALDFVFCEGAFEDRHPDEQPSVIFLDLKLPKVDGIEVLQRLKGDPRTRSIPVVVLTSSLEQKDMIETYQLGVNSYIVKPVDFEQFVETVRHLGMYWLVLNRAPQMEV